MGDSPPPTAVGVALIVVVPIVLTVLAGDELLPIPR